MRYKVRIKRKIARSIEQLPLRIQKILFLLITDLQDDGPIQKNWDNFSQLGEGRYHCHLTHRYVACWTCRKNNIIIEVYYVGSREKAPY